MCRRVQCADCKKPTFAGCGQHIEQVLGDVPPQDRCTCRDKPKQASATGGAPPSILRRFFGLDRP